MGDVPLLTNPRAHLDEIVGTHSFDDLADGIDPVGSDVPPDLRVVLGEVRLDDRFGVHPAPSSPVQLHSDGAFLLLAPGFKDENDIRYPSSRLPLARPLLPIPLRSSLTLGQESGFRILGMQLLGKVHDSKSVVNLCGHEPGRGEANLGYLSGNPRTVDRDPKDARLPVVGVVPSKIRRGGLAQPLDPFGWIGLPLRRRKESSGDLVLRHDSVSGDPHEYFYVPVRQP